MNTVRINGQDYTSSLSDAEIAFIGNLSLPTTAQTLSGAIAEHENDISELNSNLTNLTPIQRGSKTSVSLTANTYTEVRIDLPVSYTDGDSYVAFASVIVWADPSKFSCIVRNKTSNSFALRIWNGNSSATSVDIDWMTMQL